MGENYGGRDSTHGMVTVTEELIEAAKSAKGGWSKRKLAWLGVPWPPPKWWKEQVIGREITERAAVEFLNGG